MKRLNERTDALCAWLHRGVMAVMASEGLFLVIMFLFNDILNTSLFLAHRNLIDPPINYLLMPWSGMLLGFYMMREKKRCGLDIRALTLLTLWLAVPFILRFGTEYFTLNSVFSYSICFFVFYASVCGSDARRRGRQLDVACAGTCLLSIALGGALLYCAWTGRVLYSYPGTQGFGVINGQLYHGTHYNLTGGMALTCTLLCLVGLCRSWKKPYGILYLLGMIIMALVVVLTQCRTARYALLIAFALGAWNGLCEYLPLRKFWLRQGIALACAAVVLLGGYRLSAKITHAALLHYASMPSPAGEEGLTPSMPEEAPDGEAAYPESEPVTEAREAVDGTFSDRTNIWKNVFKSWKNNPKHMLIGNGSGRTRWLLAEGTIHEAAGYVEAHNAYLYFAAEFGLVGFGLLVLFLCSILRPVLRVFFAHGKARMPGGCALCMLVVAILLTGMMEIRPLEAVSTMCMTLFFALGQLTGTGRDM